MPYYHVRITPKSEPSNVETELDLSEQQLLERFVEPYNQGRPILISGRFISPADVYRIRISKTDRDSRGINDSALASFRLKKVSRTVDYLGRLPLEELADHGKDVTGKYIIGPPEHMAEVSGQPVRELPPPPNGREVFVVHGRNDRARDALFQFLRAIDLHPLEWNEAVRSTGKTSPYVGEILDAAFSRAHAVVVLFTPDDEARLRQEFRVPGDPPHETELSGQARPNVLFEAGMAMSRSEERTVLVEIGVLRPFSDVAGRHAIRFDGSTPRRQELAQRLELAGCPVNLSGTDWHTAGDFESALAATQSEDLVTANYDDHRASIAQESELSDDAKELLTEITRDSSGEILKLTTSGGFCFRTNGMHFGEIGDPREEARWEGAVQDLLKLGFLTEDPRGRGTLFKVAREGFEFVDDLRGLQ